MRPNYRMAFTASALLLTGGCLFVADYSEKSLHADRKRIATLAETAGRYSNRPAGNLDGSPLSWFLLPGSGSIKADEIWLIPTSPTNLTLALFANGEEKAKRELLLGKDFSIVDSKVPLATQYLKADDSGFLNSGTDALRSSGRLFLSREGDIILERTGHHAQAGIFLVIPYAGIKRSGNSLRYRRIN